MGKVRRRLNARVLLRVGVHHVVADATFDAVVVGLRIERRAIARQRTSFVPGAWRVAAQAEVARAGEIAFGNAQGGPEQGIASSMRHHAAHPVLDGLDIGVVVAVATFAVGKATEQVGLLGLRAGKLDVRGRGEERSRIGDDEGDRGGAQNGHGGRCDSHENGFGLDCRSGAGRGRGRLPRIVRSAPSAWWQLCAQAKFSVPWVARKYAESCECLPIHDGIGQIGISPNSPGPA